MNTANEENLQSKRDKLIEELDLIQRSVDETEFDGQLIDNLFALDLTVYSGMHSLKSSIYSAVFKSKLDGNISLHPEQIEAIDHIKHHSASIISAPTSFGKTFCIFEYIVRNTPKNIMLVAPTLALVDEYYKKITNEYSKHFSKYRVHTFVDTDTEYNFDENNLFIVTHDRVVNEDLVSKIRSLDFLVIDEVYKLVMDKSDDRVLVLNAAYMHLSKVADKYVLLAPFIGGVEDCDVLEKSPVFWSASYSPVVNKIHEENISSGKERYPKCVEIMKRLDANEKTLIYFPTVVDHQKFVREIISEMSMAKKLDEDTRAIINWIKEEIYEDWYLVVALEHGFVIHNGQIPIGLRKFQLDKFENDVQFNQMLCTSTLLEGINTTTKNIIIVKPSRKHQKEGESFTAFDFYNLVGRTGRLKKHYVGNAFYIKSPIDPTFDKKEATKTIRLEISDDSVDMDIQRHNIETRQEVMDFLKDVGITKDEYYSEIGAMVRFETVRRIHTNLISKKDELLHVLNESTTNNGKSLHKLVELVYQIVEPNPQNLEGFMIYKFLFKPKSSIHDVLTKHGEYLKSQNKRITDGHISAAIKMRTSYMENNFYSRVLVLKFLMEKIGCHKMTTNSLTTCIISPLEVMFRMDSNANRMLRDLGVYEKDIELILKEVGHNVKDAFELKNKLHSSGDAIMKNNRVSFITKYILRQII